MSHSPTRQVHTARPHKPEQQQSDTHAKLDHVTTFYTWAQLRERNMAEEKWDTGGGRGDERGRRLPPKSVGQWRVAGNGHSACPDELKPSAVSFELCTVWFEVCTLCRQATPPSLAKARKMRRKTQSFPLPTHCISVCLLSHWGTHTQKVRPSLVRPKSEVKFFRWRQQF